MNDHKELTSNTPPFVSVSWSENTYCLPKYHEVEQKACEMAHARLQRMHIPVYSNGITKIISMKLPEELCHRIKGLVPLDFAATKAPDGHLHSQDNQQHIEIAPLSNPKRQLRRKCVVGDSIGYHLHWNEEAVEVKHPPVEPTPLGLVSWLFLLGFVENVESNDLVWNIEHPRDDDPNLYVH